MNLSEVNLVHPVYINADYYSLIKASEVVAISLEGNFIVVKYNDIEKAIPLSNVKDITKLNE